jgi:hypothetical protein
MLVLIEALLVLLPFGLYLLWLRREAEPSSAMLVLTAAAVALGAGLALWIGLTQEVARDAAYVPARVEDGRIVPGGAPSRGEANRTR